MSRGGGRVGIALLVAVALVASGAAGAVVWHDPGVPSALEGGAAPTTAPAVTVEYPDPHKVSATFEFSDSWELGSPRGGRVTDLGACAPGQSIVSGARVVDLDERALVALHTATPLWRDLSVGAKGADVRSLQEELVRLRHDVVPDGSYRRSTHRAMRTLLGETGIVVKDTEAVSLSDLVWIPTPEGDGYDCEVSLGGQVLEGDVIVGLAGPLRSISLEQVPAARLDGPRVYDLGEAAVASDENGTVVDPGTLAEIESMPVVRLVREQEEGPTADLDWVLVDPVTATGVPPRSLTRLGDGRGCVSYDGQGFEVRVLASSLGTTLVTFAEGVMPPPAVDLDPAARSCG